MATRLKTARPSVAGLLGEQINNWLPIHAKRTALFFALVDDNIRVTPELLVVNGFQATLTVGGTLTAGTYSANVGGTVYSYIATASDTNQTVANGLAAAINADVATAFEARVNALVITIYRSTTFTLTAATAPTPGTLTAGTVSGSGTAAKGGTAIALVGATANKILQNQWLAFFDKTGRQYLAKVTATANAGVSSLTVAPLHEAIPAGCTASFGVYLYNATSFEISSSTGFNSAPNRNSGAGVVGTPGDTEITLTVSALRNMYDAGQLTLMEAHQSQQLVFAQIRYPIEDTAIYATGWEEWVVGYSQAGGQTGETNPETSYEIAVVGGMNRIAPVAV